MKGTVTISLSRLNDFGAAWYGFEGAYPEDIVVAPEPRDVTLVFEVEDIPERLLTENVDHDVVAPANGMYKMKNPRLVIDR